MKSTLCRSTLGRQNGSYSPPRRRANHVDGPYQGPTPGAIGCQEARQVHQEHHGEEPRPGAAAPCPWRPWHGRPAPWHAGL